MLKMDFFEPNILQKPIINSERTRKWLLEQPYTPKIKQLKVRFTKSEYDKNPNQYLSFNSLKNEFICVNPGCQSHKVECIWYLYQEIAPRVDETFAEFYCPDCKKYSFVEYSRDDS